MDTVLVCRGKACRKEGTDERALRSLHGAAREGHRQLVVVDCLSACDDAPIVVLAAEGAEPRWFGRLTKHILALCDVVAGRDRALPERLARRQLSPGGKSDKRAARALRGAGP